MKRFFLLICILLITNIYALDTEKYFNAKSGLRIQKNSDIRSKIIIVIPFNEKAEIIEEKNDTVAIENISGKWTKVRHKNNVGWAFTDLRYYHLPLEV